MDEQLDLDLNNLHTILDTVKNEALNFLEGLPERPTSSSADADLQHKLNADGKGTSETLNEFKKRFEPLIVGSPGPRYWGFVTGGSTPASIAGDWLATVFDQNTQSVKGYGDISANIEQETIQLILDLLNLPSHFTGGFVTGATMSNFTCLAVARQWLGKQYGYDFARDGLNEKLNILSATPHSSTIKSLSMLGIGSGNMTMVKVQDGNRESIDIIDLERKIKTLNGKPFILVSSAATVNTADYDDFEQIAALRNKYSFWWHIDAAFGGFAACSEKYSHLLKGWEGADSITVDCHKWMNVPYESAVWLIQDKHRYCQVETFQNSNAPYLGDPAENFSYLNFLPENSRRLKALPAWFSLKAYGKKGYQYIVENSVACAKQFGTWIESSEAFELLAPVRLNTVCFRLKNESRQTEFLSLLNQTGKVFMTPTNYKGKNGIRAAFVNWRTHEEDVNLVIKEMKTMAASM